MIYIPVQSGREECVSVEDSRADIAPCEAVRFCFTGSPGQSASFGRYAWPISVLGAIILAV